MGQTGEFSASLLIIRLSAKEAARWMDMFSGSAGSMGGMPAQFRGNNATGIKQWI